MFDPKEPKSAPETEQKPTDEQKDELTEEELDQVSGGGSGDTGRPPV